MLFTLFSDEALVPLAPLGGSSNATKGINVGFREPNFIVKHQ